ncbi:MAG: zinc-finger domain-containing protein [Pseudomonadota bacterium]
MSGTESITETVVEVTAADLPLACPMPSKSIWNAHPKVALAVEKTGEARCPYCGTLYKFKGELPKGHH